MTCSSRRWRQQHGKKVIHNHRIGGYLHIFQVWLKYHDTNWQHMDVYECHWGKSYKDGETASRHYHVGRRDKHGLRLTL